MINFQFSKKTYLLIILASLCSIAAIYLILVRFEARSLQAQLNQLDQTKLELREQNRRYLIEIASFTDYPELHIKAIEEYALVFPSTHDGSLIGIDDLVVKNQNRYQLAKLQE